MWLKPNIFIVLKSPTYSKGMAMPKVWAIDNQKLVVQLSKQPKVK